jgi:hypothetical protein
MGKIINRMRERAEEAESRRWLASDECPSFLRPLPFPVDNGKTLTFRRYLPYVTDHDGTLPPKGAGIIAVDTKQSTNG